VLDAVAVAVRVVLVLVVRVEVGVLRGGAVVVYLLVVAGQVSRLG